MLERMNEGGESPREASGESGGIVRRGEKGTSSDSNQESSDRVSQSLKDLHGALRKALDSGDFDEAKRLDSQIEKHELYRTLDQKKKGSSVSKGERKPEKGESSARDMGESEVSRTRRPESKSSREKSGESGSGGRVSTSNSSGESGSADRGRHGGGRSTGRGLIINSNGESS